MADFTTTVLPEESVNKTWVAGPRNHSYIEKILWEIYVHDGVVTGPYAAHPVITALTRWRSQPAYQQTVLLMRVAGYHSYPPLPTSLTDYKNSFTEPADFQVTPVEELEKIADDLRFCESRRVVIQGFVLRVRFVPRETGNRPQTAEVTLQEEPRVYSLRSAPRRPVSDSEGEPEVTTKRAKKSTNSSSKPYEVVVDDSLHTLTRTTTHVTGTQTPSPSFLPRGYDPLKKAEILSAVNFPPNPSGKAWTQESLSELSVFGSSGYFVITVCGLNRNRILHTLFLAPPDLSQHATFLHMLANSDFDSHSDNPTQPPVNLVNRLLRTSMDCGEVRMLFVLDLYNPGGQEVELIVNRAFPVGDNT